MVYCLTKELDSADITFSRWMNTWVCSRFCRLQRLDTLSFPAGLWENNGAVLSSRRNPGQHAPAAHFQLFMLLFITINNTQTGCSFAQNYMFARKNKRWSWRQSRHFIGYSHGILIWPAFSCKERSYQQQCQCPQ